LDTDDEALILFILLYQKKVQSQEISAVEYGHFTIKKAR